MHADRETFTIDVMIEGMVTEICYREEVGNWVKVMLFISRGM